MKTIKYMFIGAMMTVIAAPTFAQGDANQVGLQVYNIIKSNPDAKSRDKEITAIYKTVKKDAKAIAKIGRAYMDAKDFENAQKYADLAMKANKNCADGYVLAGDICVIKDDGGAASGWYEQAIYFDPKDPEGYRKYAVTNSKTSPSSAQEKLEALRANCPGYPVDIVAAEMMMNVGKTEQAIEYYKKSDKAQMTEDQLTNFAVALLTSQDIQGCLDVATFGHNKTPRYGAFNRLMLYNNTDLKNFDAAIKAGNLLFNESDSVDFKNADYAYMARAFEGANQIDKAIEYYEKYQSLDGVGEAEKNQILKSISDSYAKGGNYTKAHEFLAKYIETQKKTFNMLESVATLYVKEMQDDRTSADQKKAAYEKADAIYAGLANDFEENAVYVANERGTLAFKTEGEDMAKLKLAGPHFATLASLIEVKGEGASAGEVKVLKKAYNYLIPYYVHCVDNMNDAKTVAEKLIKIDPENANAKAILGAQ